MEKALTRAVGNKTQVNHHPSCPFKCIPAGSIRGNTVYHYCGQKICHFVSTYNMDCSFEKDYCGIEYLDCVGHLATDHFGILDQSSE